MKQTSIVACLLILMIVLASCGQQDSKIADSKYYNQNNTLEKEKSEDTLTIVSWGGTYSKAQNEAYHKPFAEKHGIKIKNIDRGSAAPAGIRSQIESGHVSWDVVDVVESESIGLCDNNLVETIDYDSALAKGDDGSLPSEDFIGGLHGCFIPTTAYSTLFAYNTKAFGNNPPQSIADIFDLKRFSGKISLEKQPYNNLEWALIADGVAISDLYDILSTAAGIERAFKKLDSIKNSVIWWTTGEQPAQFLADGEVAIASGFSGRFFDAIIKDNQNINILWTDQSVELSGWVIPKGQLNQVVKDYIFFATDSQRLANQSKWIAYGSVRKSSEPLISSYSEAGMIIDKHVPTSVADIKPVFFKNQQFWMDNGESLSTRFDDWLVQ